MMFVSTKQLVRDYGVDEQIARFFVDREPPEDNLYWHEKLLYLRPTAGYIFIPLIIDLLHKVGIDRDSLLSEEIVSVMEKVGHISALEEVERISTDEAIKQCASLVEDVSKNGEWFRNVSNYFAADSHNIFYDLVTPFKALHRGDVFLFSLAVLDFPKALFRKVAEQWFALISTLLLIDDAEDLESDKATGDENAFIESGLNGAGVTRLTELVKVNVGKIASLNPTMAMELQRQAEEKLEAPIILALKNL